MTPDVVHSDNLAIAAVAFLAAALLIASIVAFNLSRERLARGMVHALARGAGFLQAINIIIANQGVLSSQLLLEQSQPLRFVRQTSGRGEWTQPVGDGATHGLGFSARRT
jgi:cytochrome bd-type quinol oxidase subunit 1